MKKDLIYDTWLPYEDYEKAECDVKLHDGTIVHHCWPNAGKFNQLCSAGLIVKEKDVAEIMYRKYYVDDLCKGNCDNLHESIMEVLRENAKAEYAERESPSFPVYDRDGAWDRGPFGARTRPGYTHVREGKKIHNNDLCPCLDGRGLKYKKCCKNKK